MVPNELKDRKQWVCWKYIQVNGRKTKIPITPNTGRKARTNDASTWNSYEDAVEMSKYYNGIGYVFSKDDPYIGIDIDHCIEDGELQAFAAGVISEANSYTELSPSGTGIHIIGKGKLPGGVSGKRSLAIEVYQSMRFFTVTNQPYKNSKTEIADVQPLIESLFKDVLTDETPEEKEKKAGYAVDFKAEAASPSDYEFLENVLFKQRDGDLLRALYDGENPRFDGDCSRNDMFFCNKINWANGNDLAQTDRIFRSSGRMRPKWDERHYSNGDTYGQALLRKSVHMNPKKQAKQTENVDK